jgi:hypothetical protein
MEDFIKSWHEAKNQTTIEPTEETQKIRDQLVHELYMSGVRKEPESVREVIREKIRQIPIYQGPIKAQVEQPSSNVNNTNRSKKDECIIF